MNAALQTLKAQLAPDSTQRWSLAYSNVESSESQQDIDSRIATAIQRHQSLKPLFDWQPASPLYRYAVFGNLTELARLTAIKQYESANQAYAQLQTVLQYMDSLQAVADDALYALWRDLRVTITHTIKDQALTLPNIEYIHLQQAKPALLVAYERYDDATKESDLVKRNQVPHAAFMVGDIECITEKNNENLV